MIRAFNEDKPYAQFVREQLAGDEIDRENPDVLDATGYLRLWIYEYNQRDVEGQWGAILNDLTDVTGEAFLGISIGCARCHDHKFDPLLQKDYYRLQAYFSGILPRDDVPLANAEEYAAYLKKLAEWEAETATLREAMAKLEQPVRDKTIANAIEKFPPPVRPALRKEDHQRTAREKQLAHLAFLQIKNEIKGLDFKKKLKDEALKEWESLSEQLAKHKEKKPQPFPNRLTIADVGVEAAEVCIPGAADEKIEPGILSLLQPQPMSIKALPQLNSSGRRLALAEWMVSPENPLTWRVIVNRVWQHHFGRGIVENTSDFGKLTSLPTHPELLDWLANWFVDHQGSFKQLHRLVMNSETYKQQSYPESATKYVQVDADNRYLWRFAARRLDAEQLRDSMLAVSGDIDYAGSGPSVEASSLRRSVFRKAMRNSPDAFLARFDAPDGSSSTAKRASTTTSVQALLLINSPWTIERAERLAKRVKEVGREPSEQITYLYREAFGRAPSDQEQKIGLDFLKDGKLEDFCHVVLSSNEFFFWE